MKEETCELLRFYGLSCGEAEVERLRGFRDLLESRRTWGSLASKGLQDRWHRVLAESLAAARACDLPAGSRAVDIGAGGGLLGMPLAIVRPRIAVCLVESRSRKAAFLAEAAGALGLGNVEVRNDRAQALLGAEAFDLAVSRAAGKLEEMGPLALGLLRRGGRYVAVKSSAPGEEARQALGAIEGAGGRLVGVHPVAFPAGTGGDGGASLVLVEKL